MHSSVDSASRYKDISSKTSLTKTQLMSATSFNTLTGIPKQLKQIILSEGDRLVQAPELCDEIWKSMRKGDFDKQSEFTQVMVDFVFEKHKESFKLLLNVNNTQELFNILDQDENGALNEDEQILFFSLVKEKMSQCANHLANLQEYTKYKALMKALRKLEENINIYQNEVRQKIYQQNLDAYHQIGQDKLDNFYSKYDHEFHEFNRISLEKMENMKQLHEENMQKLMEKLERPSEAIKYKPKKKLRELQTNEKLVVIDERVEEALNFRKELKELEVSEAERLNKLRMEHIEKQRNKLLLEQKKEIEQLERKLKIEENNLIIKMTKEFDILKKQIHLHEHEIQKIQGLATKYAWKKGLIDGELKRTKEKSRKQNSVLTEAKALELGDKSPKKMPMTTLNQTEKSNLGSARKIGNSMAQFAQTFTNISAGTNLLKNVAKSNNITRFNIRPKYINDLPVNISLDSYNSIAGDRVNKIEKFLKYDKHENNNIPILTSLYDDNLQIKTIEKNNVERITETEKLKKRSFINEKLMRDKKVLPQLLT